eukprot:GHVS01039171.1.p1 GENE.GHVS01039171.1~~GHVS01039171.1.p1  ORF type:complete len:1091 (+),score=198.42 GHVS01039171.1:92-3274(+)
MYCLCYLLFFSFSLFSSGPTLSESFSTDSSVSDSSSSEDAPPPYSPSTNLEVSFTPVEDIPGTWLVNAATPPDVILGSNGLVRLSIDGRPAALLHCPHYHLILPGINWRADLLTLSGTPYYPNQKTFVHGILSPPPPHTPPPHTPPPSTPTSLAVPLSSFPAVTASEDALRNITVTVKSPQSSTGSVAAGALTVQMYNQLAAPPLVDNNTGMYRAGGGLFAELRIWDNGRHVWGPQRVFCDVVEVGLRHTKHRESRNKLRKLKSASKDGSTNEDVDLVDNATEGNSEEIEIKEDWVAKMKAETEKLMQLLQNSQGVDAVLTDERIANMQKRMKETMANKIKAGGFNKWERPIISRRQFTVKVKWYVGDTLIVGADGKAIVGYQTVLVDDRLHVASTVGHKGGTPAWDDETGTLQRQSENIHKVEKRRSALAYKEFKKLLDNQKISRLTVMKSDVTCGDPRQGSTIPRGMDQLNARLADRLSSTTSLPSLDSFTASPSIPIDVNSPVIRWSTLADNLGVPVTPDASTEPGSVYRGADLRYLMPRFDIDVRKDGTHFDVFLFAPDQQTREGKGGEGRKGGGDKQIGGRRRRGDRRADGHKLFQMVGGIRGGSNIANVGPPAYKNKGAIVGGVSAPPSRLLEAARLMRDSLQGELLVKDAKTGAVVYGPVEMNCPYTAVPVKAVEKVRVSPLMFEVKLKTLEHGVIGDELQQPLIVKRWVFRHKKKNEGGGLEEKIDTFSESEESEESTDGVHDLRGGDKLNLYDTSLRDNTCPDTMLGLRALDVDFDFFQKTPEMQSFVRDKLAKTLDVEPEDVNICHVTEGSTVLAFSAGDDLSNRWTEQLNDPSSSLHASFQIDPLYPPVLYKSSMPSAPPPSGTPDPVTAPDYSFTDLPFPVDESIVLNPKDHNEYRGDNLVLLPHQIGKGPPTFHKSGGGLPGWLWGLVAVAALVFVVGVVGLSLLMMVAKKKARRTKPTIQPVVFSAAALHAPTVVHGAPAGASAWGDAGVGVVSVVGGRPLMVGQNKVEDYTDMQKWNGEAQNVVRGQCGSASVDYEQTPNSVGYP